MGIVSLIFVTFDFFHFLLPFFSLLLFSRCTLFHIHSSDSPPFLTFFFFLTLLLFVICRDCDDEDTAGSETITNYFNCTYIRSHVHAFIHTCFYVDFIICNNEIKIIELE